MAASIVGCMPRIVAFKNKIITKTLKKPEARYVGNVDIKRFVYTSEICWDRFSSTTTRQGKMLHKLLTGSRKKYYVDSVGPRNKFDKPTASFLMPQKAKVNRRTKVLNKVLMENICDVMASGEVTPELFGTGLEITRVQVTDDFCILKVYWMTTAAENSEKIEKLLTAHAGKIKHILCSLRVLGRVPYITFVKDRHMQNVTDVELALAVADFGPDFVPTDKTHEMRSTIILRQQIPDLPELVVSEAETRVQTMKNVEPLVSTSTDAPKEMRTDLFNLDHRRLMSQIAQKMLRAQASHRTSEAGVPVLDRLDLKDADDGATDVGAKLPAMPSTASGLQRLLRNRRQRRGQPRVGDEPSADDGGGGPDEPVLGKNFLELYDAEDYYEEDKPNSDFKL